MSKEDTRQHSLRGKFALGMGALAIPLVIAGCKGERNVSSGAIAPGSEPTGIPAVQKPPVPAEVPVVVSQPTEVPTPVEKTIPVCSVDAPIPEDIQMDALDPALPNDLKAFNGAWEGIWDKDGDYGGMPSLLVVESINLDNARLRYTWGVAPAFGIERGGEKNRLSANVRLGDTIQVRGSASILTFSMNSDGTLHGVFDNHNNSATLSIIDMTRCSIPGGK